MLAYLSDSVESEVNQLLGLPLSRVIERLAIAVGVDFRGGGISVVKSRDWDEALESFSGQAVGLRLGGFQGAVLEEEVECLLVLYFRVEIVLSEDEDIGALEMGECSYNEG